MTLRTLDLASWRRAEAREMALRPPFRLNVHNRAKCDIGKVQAAWVSKVVQKSREGGRADHGADLHSACK